jgi:hypothetical protein
MAMDFSALNNPSEQKPIGLGTVLLAVGVAAADVSITGPFPFPGSSFITVPIAGLAVVKYFQQRGLDIKDAPTMPRQNPVIMGTAVGIGTLAGVAAIGAIALGAYKAYAHEEEREPAIRAVEEDPFLSLLNPTVGTAAGAAIGYAAGKPVWQGALYGLFFGVALRRMAIELIHSRSKVR